MHGKVMVRTRKVQLKSILITVTLTLNLQIFFCIRHIVLIWYMFVPSYLKISLCMTKLWSGQEKFNLSLFLITVTLTLNLQIFFCIWHIVFIWCMFVPSYLKISLCMTQLWSGQGKLTPARPTAQPPARFAKLITRFFLRKTWLKTW